MSEAKEKEEGERGEWLETFVLIGLFAVLRHVLKLWLGEAAATGVANMAVMFTLYKLTPEPKLSLGRWAVLSLLFTLYVVMVFFGAPKLLCPRIGSVWTWGVLTAGFFLSFRWLPALLRRGVEGGFWEWLAVSIGFGSAAAFFAYINPEGFCR